MLYLLNPSLIPFLSAVSFLLASQLLEAGILLTSSFEVAVEMLDMEVQGNGFLIRSPALASGLVNNSTELCAILFIVHTKSPWLPL